MPSENEQICACCYLYNHVYCEKKINKLSFFLSFFLNQPPMQMKGNKILPNLLYATKVRYTVKKRKGFAICPRDLMIPVSKFIFRTVEK